MTDPAVTTEIDTREAAERDIIQVVRDWVKDLHDEAQVQMKAWKLRAVLDRVEQLERDRAFDDDRTECAVELLAAVLDLVKAGPCKLDTWGDCEAHGFFGTTVGEGCPHALARAFLAGARAHTAVRAAEQDAHVKRNTARESAFLITTDNTLSEADAERLRADIQIKPRPTKPSGPLCGDRIPEATAKNLGANPATTCARIPDHFGFGHQDADGDVMWMDPKPSPTEDAK